MAEPDAGLVGLQHSFWSIAGANPQNGPRRPPESRFRAFQAPARKVVPGGLQRVVLEHFRRQPAKWSQEASRGSFSTISGASPPSGPRRPPEARFGAFQAAARKVAPGGLQRVVLEHFRRQRGKWPQEASRGSFWSISSASAESGPRRPCKPYQFSCSILGVFETGKHPLEASWGHCAGWRFKCSKTTLWRPPGATFRAGA